MPVSRLSEIIDESKKDSENLGIFTSVVGHVGDGNWHMALIYNPADEEHVAAVKNCVHKMMKRALDMDGTVSGEHAIGIGKKHGLVHELGTDTVLVMKQLKQALDPK